jgi:hypothetical protein
MKFKHLCLWLMLSMTVSVNGYAKETVMPKKPPIDYLVLFNPVSLNGYLLSIISWLMHLPSPTP